MKIGLGVAAGGRDSHHKLARQGQQRCQPSSLAAAPVFDRWIRTDASEHWKGVAAQECRVWVGGLPRMRNHYAVNDEVRKFFSDFEPYAFLTLVLKLDKDDVG